MRTINSTIPLFLAKSGVKQYNNNLELKIHFASFFALIIFGLLLIPTGQYIGHALTSNFSNPFDFTNLSKSKSVVSINATSDQEKFTADEINATFYNLYENYLKSDKNRV